MANIQYYQEFCDPAKTRPTGNVVVVYPQTPHFVAERLVYEGVGRISPNILQPETFIAPNQLVTHWKVDRVWLEQYCLQISEQRARQIHPRLFESYMNMELQEHRKAQREHWSHLFLMLSLGLALVYGYRFANKAGSRLR